MVASFVAGVNVIDHADSREEAVAKGTRSPRCDYAGVRIIEVTGNDAVDAEAEPTVIVGV